MKLHQLASKPQLIKYEIKDPAVIEQYGEAIEFWSWDRQPLEVFMKLASASGTDQATMIEIVRKLILDEEGNEIIKDEVMLPSNLLILVIGMIVERLGK